MRKVLAVTDEYPPSLGGIAQVASSICASLPPDGIVVLANAQKGDAEYDRSQKYPIARLPYSTASQFQTLLSALRFTVRGLTEYRRRGCSLLYLTAPWPFGLIGLAAKVLGIRYVIHTYGNDFLVPKNALVEWVRLRALRDAWRVIVIADFGRDQLVKRGIDPRRIVKIRPKIDPSRFAGAVDAEAVKEREGLAGKRVLLSVGRLVERKGVDRVIEALPEILRAHPNTVYVVVGDDLPGRNERGRLEKLAATVGASDHVLFTGARPDADVTAFYHACDAFVMVSRYIEEKGDVEGFGIVYLEANACGKPVVAGRSGGVPDAVADGESGILVDPDDVQAIAKAINALLDDDELRVRLGRQGRERVLREFTFEKYGEEFRRLILDEG